MRTFFLLFVRNANKVHIRSPTLTPVTTADKNIFAIAAKHALLDLGWSVADLARRIKRPRSTVSRAIHTNKLPKVRRLVARRLSIPDSK